MEQIDSKLEDVLCKLLDARKTVDASSEEGKKIDEAIVKLTRVRNESLKIDNDVAAKSEDRQIEWTKLSINMAKNTSEKEKETERLELEKKRLELEIKIRENEMELAKARLELDRDRFNHDQSQSWWSKWGPAIIGTVGGIAGNALIGGLNYLAEDRTVDKILNYEEENTITTKAGNYAGKFRPFGRK